MFSSATNAMLTTSVFGFMAVLRDRGAANATLGIFVRAAKPAHFLVVMLVAKILAMGTISANRAVLTMLEHVLRLISYLKVFNSVVFSVFVNVVNYLIFPQISSEVFFHDKAMFRDISVSAPFWMAPAFDIAVSVRHHHSTFIAGIVFWRCPKKFMPAIQASLCVVVSADERSGAVQAGFHCRDYCTDEPYGQRLFI